MKKRFNEQRVRDKAAVAQGDRPLTGRSAGFDPGSSACRSFLGQDAESQIASNVHHQHMNVRL